MISYKEHILENGLKVLVHEDPSTPMSVVNLLYKVGARDEDEDKTGFAHLFEHLMFGGSLNAPSFDQVLERAGGENNAFTNNDMTNYYDIIPAVNIETALWLEADRMRSLHINATSLKTQQKVVVEEFKENYLNQPYGDVWHIIREMAYKSHPYKWPTIGKDISHIEKARLTDVQFFFEKYYRPNNAILTVAGGVKTKNIFDLVEKHFAGINRGNELINNISPEPDTPDTLIVEVVRDVPASMIYKIYLMCDRLSKDYYIYDLVTDVLSGGRSAILYKELVKEKKLFTSIDAYITGSLDRGLLIINGRLAPETNMDSANKAIDEVLRKMAERTISMEELQKTHNKIESTHEFNEINLMNRAFGLAYAASLGDANIINVEKGIYLSITADEIRQKAFDIFFRRNSMTLFYKAKKRN